MTQQGWNPHPGAHNPGAHNPGAHNPGAQGHPGPHEPAGQRPAPPAADAFGAQQHFQGAASASPIAPHRAPANLQAVQCAACGGPITLKSFGNLQRVVCPYCGSISTPADNGALALIERANRQRRPSALPLHARGQLEGVQWEVIGIQWRQTTVSGITYPWQEFLLYHPYEGFRFLIYSMTDGHWSLAEIVDCAVRQSNAGHRSCTFDGKTFKHFQASDAEVSYVEGEFTWEVSYGERAAMDDFVAPPEGLSVERTDSDLTFTKMRWIAADEVWKAFGQTGNPPPVRGVGMLQPNPARAHRPFFKIATPALLGLWLIASVAYCGTRDTKEVHATGSRDYQEFVTDVEFGQPGVPQTLEFELTAPVDNSWAYVEILLIDPEREEALALGVETGYYHGVSDGERWSEGSRSKSVTMGGIPGGRYIMQVAPQRGVVGGTAPASWSLRVKSDVIFARYVVLPLFLILLIPLFNLLRGFLFEYRRWQNSDYAGGDD